MERLSELMVFYKALRNFTQVQSLLDIPVKKYDTSSEREMKEKALFGFLSK